MKLKPNEYTAEDDTWDALKQAPDVSQASKRTRKPKMNLEGIDTFESTLPDHNLPEAEMQMMLELLRLARLGLKHDK